jgi:tetratricopeptide (TPR) repeat protein
LEEVVRDAKIGTTGIAATIFKNPSINTKIKSVARFISSIKSRGATLNAGSYIDIASMFEGITEEMVAAIDGVKDLSAVKKEVKEARFIADVENLIRGEDRKWASEAAFVMVAGTEKSVDAVSDIVLEEGKLSSGTTGPIAISTMASPLAMSVTGVSQGKPVFVRVISNDKETVYNLTSHGLYVEDIDMPTEPRITRFEFESATLEDIVNKMKAYGFSLQEAAQLIYDNIVVANSINDGVAKREIITQGDLENALASYSKVVAIDNAITASLDAVGATATLSSQLNVKDAINIGHARNDGNFLWNFECFARDILDFAKAMPGMDIYRAQLVADISRSIFDAKAIDTAEIGTKGISQRQWQGSLTMQQISDIQGEVEGSTALLIIQLSGLRMDAETVNMAMAMFGKMQRSRAPDILKTKVSQMDLPAFVSFLTNANLILDQSAQKRQTVAASTKSIRKLARTYDISTQDALKLVNIVSRAVTARERRQVFGSEVLDRATAVDIITQHSAGVLTAREIRLYEEGKISKDKIHQIIRQRAKKFQDTVLPPKISVLSDMVSGIEQEITQRTDAKVSELKNTRKIYKSEIDMLASQARTEVIREHSAVIQPKVQALQAETREEINNLSSQGRLTPEKLEELTIKLTALADINASLSFGHELYEVQLLSVRQLVRARNIDSPTGSGKTKIIAAASQVLDGVLGAMGGDQIRIYTQSDQKAQIDHGLMAKFYENAGISSTFITDHDRLNDKDKVKDAFKNKRVVYMSLQLLCAENETQQLALEQGSDEVYISNKAFGIIDEIDKETYEGQNIDHIMNATTAQVKTMDEAIGVVSDAIAKAMESEGVDLEWVTREVLLQREQKEEIEEVSKATSTKSYFAINGTNVVLTEAGKEFVKDRLKNTLMAKLGVSIPTALMIIGKVTAEHIEAALYANVVLRRDTHYLINGEKGEVELLNHETDKLVAEGRRLQDKMGLALEIKAREEQRQIGLKQGEKEVQIKDKGRTFNVLSVRTAILDLHIKAVGASGSIFDARQEYEKSYNTETDLIAGHYRSRMKEYDDGVFLTDAARTKDRVNLAVRRHKEGLITKISVADANGIGYIKAMLLERGVREEDIIIADAKMAKNADELETKITDLQGKIIIDTVLQRGFDLGLLKFETIEDLEDMLKEAEEQGNDIAAAFLKKRKQNMELVFSGETEKFQGRLKDIIQRLDLDEVWFNKNERKAVISELEACFEDLKTILKRDRKALKALEQLKQEVISAEIEGGAGRSDHVGIRQDIQIIGRLARQNDPGTHRFDISLEKSGRDMKTLEQGLITYSRKRWLLFKQDKKIYGEVRRLRDKWEKGEVSRAEVSEVVRKAMGTALENIERNQRKARLKANKFIELRESLKKRLLERRRKELVHSLVPLTESIISQLVEKYIPEKEGKADLDGLKQAFLKIFNVDLKVSEDVAENKREALVSLILENITEALNESTLRERVKEVVDGLFSEFVDTIGRIQRESWGFYLPFKGYRWRAKRLLNTKTLKKYRKNVGLAAVRMAEDSRKDGEMDRLMRSQIKKIGVEIINLTEQIIDDARKDEMAKYKKPNLLKRTGSAIKRIAGLIVDRLGGSGVVQASKAIDSKTMARVLPQSLYGSDAAHYHEMRQDAAAEAGKEEIVTIDISMQTSKEAKRIKQEKAEKESAKAEKAFKKGKYDKALEGFKRVQVLNPGFEGIEDRIKAVEIKIKAKKDAQDIKAARKAERDALIAYGSGKYDKAIKYYQTALQLDENNRRLQESIEDVRKVAADKAKDEARRAIAKGKHDKAIEHCDKAIQYYKSAIEFRQKSQQDPSELAGLMEDASKLKKEAVDTKRAKLEAEQDARILRTVNREFKKANSAYTRGRYGASLTHIDNVLRMDPNHPEKDYLVGMMKDIARSYQGEGRLEDAKIVWNKVLEIAKVEKEAEKPAVDRKEAKEKKEEKAIVAEAEKAIEEIETSSADKKEKKKVSAKPKVETVAQEDEISAVEKGEPAAAEKKEIVKEIPETDEEAVKAIEQIDQLIDKKKKQELAKELEDAKKKEEAVSKEGQKAKEAESEYRLELDRRRREEKERSAQYVKELREKAQKEKQERKALGSERRRERREKIRQAARTISKTIDNLGITYIEPQAQLLDIGKLTSISGEDAEQEFGIDLATEDIAYIGQDGRYRLLLTTDEGRHIVVNMDRNLTLEQRKALNSIKTKDAREKLKVKIREQGAVLIGDVTLGDNVALEAGAIVINSRIHEGKISCGAVVDRVVARKVEAGNNAVIVMSRANSITASSYSAVRDIDGLGEDIAAGEYQLIMDVFSKKKNEVRKERAIRNIMQPTLTEFTEFNRASMIGKSVLKILALLTLTVLGFVQPELLPVIVPLNLMIAKGTKKLTLKKGLLIAFTSVASMVIPFSTLLTETIKVTPWLANALVKVLPSILPMLVTSKILGGNMFSFKKAKEEKEEKPKEVTKAESDFKTQMETELKIPPEYLFTIHSLKPDASGSAASAVDLARRSLEEGDIDNALRHINRALKHNPRSKEAYLLYADIMYEDGKDDKAEEFYAIAAALQRKEDKDVDPVITLLDRALGYIDMYPGALIDKSVSKTGTSEKAEACLKRIKEALPSSEGWKQFDKATRRMILLRIKAHISTNGIVIDKSGKVKNVPELKVLEAKGPKSLKVPEDLAKEKDKKIGDYLDFARTSLEEGLRTDKKEDAIKKYEAAIAVFDSLLNNVPKDYEDKKDEYTTWLSGEIVKIWLGVVKDTGVIRGRPILLDILSRHEDLPNTSRIAYTIILNTPTETLKEILKNNSEEDIADYYFNIAKVMERTVDYRVDSFRTKLLSNVKSNEPILRILLGTSYNLFINATDEYKKRYLDSVFSAKVKGSIISGLNCGVVIAGEYLKDEGIQLNPAVLIDFFAQDIFGTIENNAGKNPDGVRDMFERITQNGELPFVSIKNVLTKIIKAKLGGKADVDINIYRYLKGEDLAAKVKEHGIACVSKGSYRHVVKVDGIAREAGYLLVQEVDAEVNVPKDTFMNSFRQGIFMSGQHIEEANVWKDIDMFNCPYVRETYPIFESDVLDIASERFGPSFNKKLGQVKTEATAREKVVVKERPKSKDRAVEELQKVIVGDKEKEYQPQQIAVAGGIQALHKGALQPLLKELAIPGWGVLSILSVVFKALDENSQRIHLEEAESVVIDKIENGLGMPIRAIDEPRLIKSSEHWALGMVIRGPTGEEVFYVQRPLLNRLIQNNSLILPLINHEKVEQILVAQGLTPEEAHLTIIGESDIYEDKLKVALSKIGFGGSVEDYRNEQKSLMEEAQEAAETQVEMLHGRKETRHTPPPRIRRFIFAGLLDRAIGINVKDSFSYLSAYHVPEKILEIYSKDRENREEFNRILTMKLFNNIDLTRPSSIDNIHASYFDAETEMELKENFPEILSLLTNMSNTKNLLSALSILRLIFPYTQIGPELLDPPLKFAIEEDLYFVIGKTKENERICVSPITRSFRRHIVFILDKSGKVKFAKEIKIPGEEKPFVSESNFSVTKELYTSGVNVVKPCMFVELPEDSFRMYWAQQSHLHNRIVVYDYNEDGNRLVNLIPGLGKGLPEENIAAVRSKLERKAEEYGLTYKEIAESIAFQAFKFLHSLHASDYTITTFGWTGEFFGQNSYGSLATDMHLENLRIIFGKDGVKVINVGDFGPSARKISRERREKDRKVGLRDRLLGRKLPRDYYSKVNYNFDAEARSLWSQLNSLLGLSEEELGAIFTNAKLEIYKDEAKPVDTKEERHHIAAWELGLLSGLTFGVSTLTIGLRLLGIELPDIMQFIPAITLPISGFLGAFAISIKNTLRRRGEPEKRAGPLASLTNLLLNKKTPALIDEFDQSDKVTYDSEDHIAYYSPYDGKIHINKAGVSQYRNSVQYLIYLKERIQQKLNRSTLTNEIVSYAILTIFGIPILLLRGIKSFFKSPARVPVLRLATLFAIIGIVFYGIPLLAGLPAFAPVVAAVKGALLPVLASIKGAIVPIIGTVKATSVGSFVFAKLGSLISFVTVRFGSATMLPIVQILVKLSVGDLILRIFRVLGVPFLKAKDEISWNSSKDEIVRYLRKYYGVSEAALRRIAEEKGRDYDRLSKVALMRIVREIDKANRVAYKTSSQKKEKNPLKKVALFGWHLFDSFFFQFFRYRLVYNYRGGVKNYLQDIGEDEVENIIKGALSEIREDGTRVISSETLERGTAFTELKIRTIDRLWQIGVFRLVLNIIDNNTFISGSIEFLRRRFSMFLISSISSGFLGAMLGGEAVLGQSILSIIPSVLQSPLGITAEVLNQTTVGLGGLEAQISLHSFMSSFTTAAGMGLPKIIEQTKIRNWVRSHDLNKESKYVLGTRKTEWTRLIESRGIPEQAECKVLKSLNYKDYRKFIDSLAENWDKLGDDAKQYAFRALTQDILEGRIVGATKAQVQNLYSKLLNLSSSEQRMFSLAEKDRALKKSRRLQKKVRYAAPAILGTFFTRYKGVPFFNLNTLASLLKSAWGMWFVDIEIQAVLGAGSAIDGLLGKAGLEVDMTPEAQNMVDVAKGAIEKGEDPIEAAHKVASPTGNPNEISEREERILHAMADAQEEKADLIEAATREAKRFTGVHDAFALIEGKHGAISLGQRLGGFFEAATGVSLTNLSYQFFGGQGTMETNAQLNYLDAQLKRIDEEIQNTSSNIENVKYIVTSLEQGQEISEEEDVQLLNKMAEREAERLEANLKKIDETKGKLDQNILEAEKKEAEKKESQETTGAAKIKASEVFKNVRKEMDDRAGEIQGEITKLEKWMSALTSVPAASAKDMGTVQDLIKNESNTLEALNSYQKDLKTARKDLYDKVEKEPGEIDKFWRNLTSVGTKMEEEKPLTPEQELEQAIAKEEKAKEELQKAKERLESEEKKKGGIFDLEGVQLAGPLSAALVPETTVVSSPSPPPPEPAPAITAQQAQLQIKIDNIIAKLPAESPLKPVLTKLRQDGYKVLPDALYQTLVKVDVSYQTSLNYRLLANKQRGIIQMVCNGSAFDDPTPFMYNGRPLQFSHDEDKILRLYNEGKVEFIDPNTHEKIEPYANLYGTDEKIKIEPYEADWYKKGAYEVRDVATGEIIDFLEHWEQRATVDPDIDVIYRDFNTREILPDWKVLVLEESNRPFRTFIKIDGEEREVIGGVNWALLKLEKAQRDLEIAERRVEIEKKLRYATLFDKDGHIARCFATRERFDNAVREGIVTQEDIDSGRVKLGDDYALNITDLVYGNNYPPDVRAPILLTGHVVGIEVDDDCRPVKIYYQETENGPVMSMEFKDGKWQEAKEIAQNEDLALDDLEDDMVYRGLYRGKQGIEENWFKVDTFGNVKITKIADRASGNEVIFHTNRLEWQLKKVDEDTGWVEEEINIARAKLREIDRILLSSDNRDPQNVHYKAREKLEKYIYALENWGMTVKGESDDSEAVLYESFDDLPRLISKRESTDLYTNFRKLLKLGEHDIPRMVYTLDEGKSGWVVYGKKAALIRKALIRDATKNSELTGYGMHFGMVIKTEASSQRDWIKTEYDIASGNRIGSIKEAKEELVQWALENREKADLRRRRSILTELKIDIIRYLRLVAGTARLLLGE